MVDKNNVPNKEAEPVVSSSLFCGWIDGILTTPDGESFVLQ